MITVGDIRKAIEGLPDDAQAIVLLPYAGAEGGLGAPPTQTQVVAVRCEPHTPRLEIDI